MLKAANPPLPLPNPGRVYSEHFTVQPASLSLSDRQRDFLEFVQHKACKHFGTVLGRKPMKPTRTIYTSI